MMRRMKRAVCLILAVVMALSLAPAAVARESAAAEDDTPIAVTVNVYSNLFGLEALPGLVVGKSFYMSVDLLAYLTDSMPLEPTEEYPVRLQCFSGALVMELNFYDGDVVPMMEYNGEIYMSAPHFLRFMGFNVSFGEKPGDKIHMYVYRQYTVLDAWAEYASSSTYRFNICEAYTENNILLYLSALDTVLLGYDSNLVRYIIDADTVEKEIYRDSLLRIFENDFGSDGYTQWDKYISIFNAETDTISILADFPGVREYVYKALGQSTASIGVLNEALGGLTVFDLLSAANGVAQDLTGAAETFKAFYNLQDLQKGLLKKTLCAVDKNDELYKELPALFLAAKDAQDMMDGVYKEDVLEDVYVNLWKAAWNLLGQGPAAAWSLSTSVIGNLPVFEGILDKEATLNFATICSDIVSITSCIGSQPTVGLLKKSGNAIPASRLESGQEIMRCAMALSLMTGIAARDALIPTGWVADFRVDKMRSAQVRAKQLLNRVIAAEPALPGTQEKVTVEEDLSWMAGLTGGYGHVVEYCGDMYFWKYSGDSFPEMGTLGSFAPYNGKENKLVRRDMETGEEETLLVSGGYGAIAIAGGRIFYREGSDIWSIYLDGTDNIDHGAGNLYGTSSDGAYVVTGNYNDIISINSLTLEAKTLVSGARTVIVWDGVIYYQTSPSDNAAATAGQMTLWRIMPDGTGKLDLYTTKPDLYPDDYFPGSNGVAQIYFADDYIYFSYGAVAGSGVFFQGGRVVRVKYDGSGGEVVSRMDELCGSDFEVAPDGTVTCHYGSENFYMLFSPVEKYRIMDGSVMWYDRTSGNLEEIITLSDYDRYFNGKAGVSGTEAVDIEYVTRCGPRIYFLASQIVESDEWGNWRNTHEWTKAYFLMKDTSTGDVRVIYTVAR